MYRLSTVLLQSFFGVILFFIALDIQAQCDQYVSITPKSPIRVCLKNGPETVKLNGAFSQKPCGFEWSPNDGKISDTKVLNPTVTIDAPGTYTYKLSGAFAGTGPNLVVNGDFSQGNVNFGSEMSYTPGPACPPGNYTITNQSPANFNGAWSDCRNGGNLFLADSPSDPDVRMWYQTVNVAPNTWYLFEFDFTSVFFANPPKMVGMVNGVELGPTVDAPGATCVWITACFAWFSGSSTTAELAIKDKQAIQWGDDLAFDNIRFRAACSGMATVKIIAEEQPEIYRDTVKCYGSNIVVGGKVIADPGDYDLILPKGVNAACDTILHLNVKDLEIIVDSVRVDTITCLTPKPAIEVVKIYAISGSKVDTLNFTYLWTTNNGQIESGATSRKVIVSKAGKYNLRITYKFGKLTCTQNLSFDMKESIVLPFVDAGPDRVLDCDSTSITLLGSGPPNTTPKWTTKNGLISSGANSFQPKIGKSGTYVLQITNLVNGCSNFDTVLVTSKVVNISLSLGKDTALTCKDTVLTLTAAVTPSSLNYSFAWKTLNGNFVNGSTGPTIAVNQVGTYYVTVIDLISKCTASDTIQVGGSKVSPIASAGENKELDCLITSTNLNGSASSQGNNFSYLWSSIPAGLTIVNGTTLNPTVSKKGIYVLAVTNDLNACVSTDTVTVDLNAKLPVIQLKPFGQLNCAAKDLKIDATLGSNGQQYLYEWQTSNGSILSGEYTNIVTVNAAGDYKFIVLDTSNGCKNDTTVKVTQDLTKPTVVLNPASQLNCTTPNVALSGTGSSSGSNYSFQWTTVNGSFLGGTNTLNPSVDNAGTYWLIITDNTNQCKDSASVVVTQSSDLPKAFITPPTILGCDKISLLLDATGSTSGGNITLAWSTTNGNFVGPTNTYSPTINKGGDYQLILTNTTSNCKDTAVVTVKEDRAKPVVTAKLPDGITCKLPNSLLDATGSSTGSEYVNTWNKAGSQIAAQLTASVNTPGQYTFVTKNTVNQCVDSVVVLVNIDTIKPLANAGSDQNLVCVPDFVLLNGGSSTLGSKTVYQWTGPVGAKIDDADQLVSKAYQPGTYTLVVKDTVNGCSAADLVNVVQNVTFPKIILEKLAQINCSKPVVSLNAVGSATGSNIAYNWSTIGGNILSGAASLTPTVDRSGWYYFQIEDLLTKCVSTDSVELKADFAVPIAIAGKPDTITCSKTALSLDGSQSSAGNSYQYQWSTINGLITSGASTLAPSVSKNGDYQLIVSNVVNGCKDTAFVKIEQDIQKPVALVSVTDTLNCRNAMVTLDGSPSILQGNAVDLLWKDVNNNQVLPDKTLSISVNKQGLYRLIIQNVKNRCVDSTLVAVFENFVQPKVAINGKPVLNCKDSTIVLNASIQVTGGSQYIWKKDGTNSPLSGLNPVISTPGTYSLVATANASGCKDSTDIFIDEDKIQPIANAGLDSTLTCYNPTLTLNGFASSSGQQFGYFWKELSGKPIANPIVLNPLITNSGTYVLEVSNTTNFCKRSDTLVIANNKIPPGITSILADSINCLKNEAKITAVSPSSASNLVIDWSKVGGTVFGKDLNTLKPTVIQGGLYKLLLTNDQNGCKDSAFIKVEVDTAVQKIAIAPASYLTCKIKEIQLKTSGITNSNYDYQWLTQDGKFTSATNIANPTINAGGQYVVSATNIRNGCFSEAKITILTDTITPQPIVVNPGVVDCNRPNVQLDASASLPNGGIFLWSTANGNIQSPKDLNAVTVTKGGQYDLLLTDPTNGCFKKTTVQVDEDRKAPVANAGPDQELNCKTNDALLDGSLADQGVDFVYKWTSKNGKIKADADRSTALAGAVGTYTLLVTNLRNGCSQTDEMVVTANRPDNAIITVKLPNCDSEIGSIQILGASGGKPPYSYTLKDWQAFSKKIPDSENVPIGTYIVRIKDANDCEFKTTAEVKAPSKPKGTLSPKDPQIFEKDSVKLSLTVEAKSPLSEIIWKSKDTTYRLVDNFSIWAAPATSSLYKVYLKDVNGCKDSLENWVFVKELSEVFIPNIFSPNGDGANDFFTVFANDRTAVKVVKFEVFNRWGELVFANRNFNPNVESEGWDGRFNGKLLNPAVFVYVVQVEFVGGRTKTYKGDITLTPE